MRRAVASRARRAVAGPEAGGADDVEHAGFVFEVEEGDAAGGGGALAVGDGAADEDAGAVGDVGDGGGGDGAEVVEVVAEEFDGVVVGGDAGGPHVGDGQFDRGHAG